MALTLITAPTGEPVVATEVINHLRLEPDTSEDALLDALRVAARQRVEAATGRVMLTQTWDLTLDCFPCVIRLPYPPLISVTSITYLDVDGVSTVLDTSDYVVDSKSVIGRITPAYGESWPSTRAILNAVTVRFVCGYGDPSDVPDALKVAMLLMVGGMYEHRESLIVGTIVDDNPAVVALVGPYRVLEPA